MLNAARLTAAYGFTRGVVKVWGWSCGPWSIETESRDEFIAIVDCCSANNTASQVLAK